MVAILEEVKISIKEDYLLHYINVYGEKTHDYISKNEFFFKKGKIYGIICEQGAGGEGISHILTDKTCDKSVKIFIDGIETNNISEVSWYVGKNVKSGKIIRKELSVKDALELAVKKKVRYEDIEIIIEEFHLSRHRIDYSLSTIDPWEKWRASIAIGYASGKQIFCFPWMDSLYFFDCMFNSSVFRFFKKITQDGGMVILPTSKEQNVQKLADEIIKIKCPRFEHCISDTEYFKKYF